jgi:hypothetical protein
VTAFLATVLENPLIRKKSKSSAQDRRLSVDKTSMLQPIFDKLRQQRVGFIKVNQ